MRLLLHAGVRVTVNSAIRPSAVMSMPTISLPPGVGLDVDDVIALAHNSFTGSFAIDDLRHAWEERLEAYRREHGASA